MKTPFLAALALLSISTAFSAGDRRLPRFCAPVDTERTRWVFTPAGDAEDVPFYRMYGDTLLTEVVRGTRQWYSFRNDSCHYEGEESRLLKLTPDAPVPTSAFLHTRLGSVREVSDSGIYCSTYPLGSHGSYESELPRDGYLSTGDGREVPCRAVTETRRMSEPGDPAGDHAELESRRTRWFVDGERVPVALQIEERVICGGETLRRTVETYTLSASEMEEICEAIAVPDEEVLNNLDVRNTPDGLIVDGNLASGATLTYALSEIGGIGVMSGELTADAEGSVPEIAVPNLRPGRYILSLGLRGMQRKVLITRP